ncbi:lysozyme g-like isoform X1 [Cololabis saira]|uniref:lysozyme g-like isoform X1 n=1 Tax=Cololabis saira TaxID=129043 RepID=UPI002AD3E260|nr:lysozyme g-like isoform X1 [Cololabis saira]XP_061585931.1 lysozyme g-like isoform X1 [Cololabis saira]
MTSFGPTVLVVALLCIYTVNSGPTDYGDIRRVQTSGASQQTARQDRLTFAGVRASQQMARTDSRRMARYRTMIQRVGSRLNIDPALIAGIISRESRAGNVLQNGWGDHGNGWGLMQVDKRHHTIRGGWNSEEHLRQATDILVYFIKRIQRKFPTWTKEQQLKGGIAAYNTGDGRVNSYQGVDSRTTGRDYSNDVVARAQWYKNNRY